MAGNNTLKISEIIRDPLLQAREDYKIDHAEDIAEKIKRRIKVHRPKVIKITEEGPRFGLIYCVDGFHTLGGYELAGITMIPVQQYEGTWAEARDMATSANTGSRALPRSRADKKRAVVMALEDHPNWSSRTVAKHTDTSPNFVEDVRPEVPVANETKERVGKDGKKRKMPKLSKANEVKAKERAVKFGWKEFDLSFGYVARGVDALESLHGNAARAKRAREALETALGEINAWRPKKEGSNGEEEDEG